MKFRSSCTAKEASSEEPACRIEALLAVHLIEDQYLYYTKNSSTPQKLSNKKSNNSVKSSADTLKR